MAEPRINGLAPQIMVSDVERSIAFYTGVLDFTLSIRNDDVGYALLTREGAMIALIRTEDAASLKATSEMTAAQLWVDGIDEIWARVEPRLAEFPTTRAKAPHDRDYGVREFHLTDPDGFLMFFTQDLPAPE